ncbi:cytochrome b/b6 domain-containing protein, partial [Corynebacterium timonense]
TADGAAQDLVAVPLRRGLPRVPGGEPFPPQGEALVESAPAEAAPTEAPPAEAPPAETAPVAESTPVGAEEQAAPEGSAWARGEEPAREAAAEQPVATPARSEGVAQRAAFRRGSRAARWIGGVALALFVLGLGVLAARFLLASDAGGEFIARYDGVQPLPDDAPVGLPAWLNWAHFFNMFLMALIISTGLRVRRERRPAAYWAPTGNPRAKISLTLWMHLMLDLLWLALGAVFYILLFTTGQWMRVVPTSWEAIPNAVSAGLQFLSLEWPTDNAWVHYNALQELTYFAVIFIASPIAAVSGLRMSPWWPAGWTFFSRRTARALHFPTMLFFVGFIIVHVLLVASTGLRRNLNAMFAARGDVDPSVYATDWTGTVFFLFAAALIGLALWGARPAVAAPLARLTGTVSNR